MFPKSAVAATLLAFFLGSSVLPAHAQQSPSDPASALNSLIVAACRQNGADFASYLTEENAAAFKQLPSSQRLKFMQRFVLIDSPGRPLLSNDAEGHIVLRCETPDAEAKFNFGTPQVHDNLAFIPVTTETGETVQMGLVRENGKWRLLSLGLLMLDIPQLEKAWAAEALKDREKAAIDTLENLAEAIDTYRRAFHTLPTKLSQLGPTSNGISPDAANLVSAQLAMGKQDGYKFRYRVAAATDGGEPRYEIAAIPAEYGKTGRRSFLLDKNGKIHAADHKGALATETDPILHTDESDHSGTS